MLLSINLGSGGDLAANWGTPDSKEGITNYTAKPFKALPLRTKARDSLLAGVALIRVRVEIRDTRPCGKWNARATARLASLNVAGTILSPSHMNRKNTRGFVAC